MKLLTTSLLAISVSTAAFARDNIQITGSSTVLPYATIVAESFGENFDFTPPVVEGGGSGAGRAKLCEGIGENTVDIANSSSRMKEDEWAACEAVIGEITEVRIGYDGIVFASNLDVLNIDNLTPLQLWTALHVDSTAMTWNDIDPSFPEIDILVFIPGTKHGTREVFDIEIMEAGCKEALAVEELTDEQIDTCVEVRTDSRAIDIDGDYSETLSRLAADQNGMGVFGYSFFQNNTATLQVTSINGVTPAIETIADGSYPVSRPLYFYVKNAHLETIPGLREYIQFFVSDEMAGPGGILFEYGLVPDPELSVTQELMNNL